MRLIVAVVLAVCAMQASGQTDPNLKPWNTPEGERARPAGGEGWQIHREECIQGRLFLVVDDAAAYVEQMGWDPAVIRVYPSSQSGLSKDLILKPGPDGTYRTRRSSRHCRPAPRHVVRSEGRTTKLEIRYSFNPHTRRLELESVKNLSTSGVRTHRTDTSGPPIDGQYVPGYTEETVETVDAEGNPISDVPALSIIELARAELGVGDPVQAAILYRGHLELDPEDARARRELGIALLKTRAWEEGVAEILRAYSGDPAMAADPLGAWVVGESDAAMGKLRGDVARFAGRVDSAAGWLTVAVLLQTQGDGPAALRVLEKADAAGLDPAVGRALREALETP